MDTDMFDRQIRLWGSEGQQKITQVNIAIVGLGGLGALVCEQLARIGVRQFTLIDGDKVEITNLNRLTGFYPEHVGSFKVEVAANNIKRIVGDSARVETRHDFLKRADLHLLAHCVLLVGAIDNEGARVLLNETALRYLIPYIDIATGIHVKNGRVTDMGGRIKFVNPGTTPCLQCYRKGIDPMEAALDLMPEQDRQMRRQLGYIEGTHLTPEPSIIPLNGIVAALAVQEISKLITGFHRAWTYLHYDALNNEIKVLDKERDLKPQKTCSVCGIGGLLGLRDVENQVFITDDEMKGLEVLFNN